MGDFKPHAPCGVRLHWDKVSCRGSVFQSARLIWDVSTMGEYNKRTMQFQSARPIGTRLLLYFYKIFLQRVSIRTPHMGRIQFRGKSLGDLRVSIRTPHMWRVPALLSDNATRSSVSIRTPHMGRVFFILTHPFGFRQFQSARPIWGASTLFKHL